MFSLFFFFLPTLLFVISSGKKWRFGCSMLLWARNVVFVSQNRSQLQVISRCTSQALVRAFSSEPRSLREGTAGFFPRVRATGRILRTCIRLLYLLLRRSTRNEKLAYGEVCHRWDSGLWQPGLLSRRCRWRSLARCEAHCFVRRKIIKYAVGGKRGRNL